MRGPATSWRLWLAVVAVVFVLAMTLTFEPPWLFLRIAELLEGYLPPWFIARVLNVLLFVPLGIAIAVWRRPSWLLGAVALSLAVEFTQQLLPERSPDVLDVVTNTAGALLGYGATRWWRHRQGHASDPDAGADTGPDGETGGPGTNADHRPNDARDDRDEHGTGRGHHPTRRDEAT